ncbi:MAG: adenylosuccinate lyase [Leptospiraceae bacterium]|nr:adenylosuccinate lyase [Leptospiraceae bacterium]MDW8306051.1 adenylosuccinate lyase [Leptospiraceae bacterium]
MLERYSTEAMRQLWSLQRKFEIWRDIEIYTCEYWHKQGKITQEELEQIKAKASFSLKRIEELEAELNHDVLAFLTNLAENIGPSGRYVHYGLTSSDVVDTALSLQLREANELILKAFTKLLQVLYDQAHKYKELPMVGRTHGVHAEPITLGLKLLSHYMELWRARKRVQEAGLELNYGKISGAVGTYSQIPLELEEYVLGKLGLKVEPVSTQVIPRDRHAHYLASLASAATSVAHLAQEIRLLQKTESREVEEPFQKKQKGSSAMPHKRNPILCERLCGLARVIQGYAQVGWQNMLLWHERDISHSSAERIVLPDATSLMEYILLKMAFVVENLVVYEKKAERLIHYTGGLLFSSRALLFITEKLQISREEAYRLVQEEAMRLWENPEGPSLKERLMHREELKKIPPHEWDVVFHLPSFLEKIPRIFARVPPPI